MLSYHPELTIKIENITESEMQIQLTIMPFDVSYFIFRPDLKNLLDVDENGLFRTNTRQSDCVLNFVSMNDVKPDSIRTFITEHTDKERILPHINFTIIAQKDVRWIQLIRY